LIENYYLQRWTKFYAMLQKYLDKGTTYREEDAIMDLGRQTFRANDFYSGLADWELSFVSRPNKARTPVVIGDEISVIKRLYDKCLKLSKEYYIR